MQEDWQNISDFDHQDYSEYEAGGRGRDIQEFFDFQGVFFFLLGILGGVLVVVLALVLVQQGKALLDWLQRTRQALSRPPSYNTVSKPPRYSACEVAGLTRITCETEPPSYSQVFTVEHSGADSSLVRVEICGGQHSVVSSSSSSQCSSGDRWVNLVFIAQDPGVQLQHGAAAGPGSGLQEPGQPHQQAGQAGRHEVLQSAAVPGGQRLERQRERQRPPAGQHRGALATHTRIFTVQSTERYTSLPN